MVAFILKGIPHDVSDNVGQSLNRAQSIDLKLDRPSFSDVVYALLTFRLT